MIDKFKYNFLKNKIILNIYKNLDVNVRYTIIIFNLMYICFKTQKHHIQLRIQCFLL